MINCWRHGREIVPTACHVKSRCMSPSAISEAPATQNDGGCEFCATPATWNEGGCHQGAHACHAKCRGRHRRQIRTKRATQYHECHACHAKRRWMRVLCHACHVKRRWMSPSATPATQSAAASQATNPDQARHPVAWVPRLPRKTTVDASLCHACHVKRRWMSPSATPATQSAAASQATNPDQARHPVPWVPRLPRKTTVDASLCHACHVKRRWMSPSATPATQSAAASQATNPDQARHPVPWVPRLPRKTTVDASFVPRLPRETKVDVTKCHACHAKCRGVTGDKSGPSAPPSTMSATPATQNWRWMRVLCHACHVKRGWMSPSATPATQSAAASQATNPDQARHPVPWVPRLPRKTTVDVSFVPRLPRETRGWMSPSATPATQSAAASQATNPDQARHPVPWVPRLPRKTTVDASLCHACHVKRRWMSPSATPATQSAAASQATNPDQARHPVPWVPRLPRKTTVDASFVPHACHVKRGWMSPSATPATQSAAASQATNPDQARHPVPWVPRLPRKTTVDASFVRLPRETKVDVTKCHACHAKCRGVTGDKSGPSAPPSTMSATPATQNDGGCEFCATPATWNEGGCHQVPRLPRKVPRRHRRQIRTKRASQYHECHACHAKRRWMRVCATPATWNEGGCHQVPRLPRKVPRRHRRQIRTKRATQYHECHACHAKRRWMRVLCHACHVKRGWMSPSATPATQSAAASQATNPDQARHPVPWVPRLPRKTTVDASFVPRLPRETRVDVTKCATQCHVYHACHAKRRCVCVCVWSDCLLSLRMLSLCVCEIIVCEVCVCEIIVC